MFIASGSVMSNVGASQLSGFSLPPEVTVQLPALTLIFTVLQRAQHLLSRSFKLAVSPRTQASI